MSKYSFDIKDYSKEEMMNLIHYEGDIMNITPKILKTCTKQLYNSVNESSPNLKDLHNLKDFLDEIETFLLTYIQDNKPVKTNPPNYEVLNSKNYLEGGEKNVISNKSLSYVNVNEYKYPIGIINPIERKTITKIVSIDSIFRHNKSTSDSSDFIWELQNTETNVISLKLVSLELPIMWYTLSKKNRSNIFTIKTYNITGLDDKINEIEIPSGNYDAVEFKKILNIIFLSDDRLKFLFCDINSITAKIIIRARREDDPSGGNTLLAVSNVYYSPNFYFIIDFGITTTSYPYTLGSFLGFTNNYYEVREENETDNYINPSNPYKYSVRCETSYGNGRQNYIFISINDFSKNCISNPIVSSSNQYIGDNIIGRIPITDNFTAVMNNTSSDKIFKEREYLGPINIDKLHIKILDKYGKSIDLNNNDISLAVELTKIYANV
tara:strand:+ start:3498 stop:4808 length:1311 start_codon:yes stop_codon:yes gene_type:complete